MNGALKAAIFNHQLHSLYQRAFFFHSTPVLDQKRRSYWKHNNKRSRRTRSKADVLRNIHAYADFIVQGWNDEINDDDPSSSRGASWFKNQNGRGSRRGQPGDRGHRHRGRRGYQFCQDSDDEDDGFESIFRSALGGNHYFCYSFINEDNQHWRSSFRSSNNYGKYWNWRYQHDEDDYTSTESESCDTAASNLAADRQALGLGVSGPLKLEDVKAAYRACALKWHPDRHHGSSKAVAEEKFKLCSSAYQSLCDKLTVT